jgi:hypothetical protein
MWKASSKIKFKYPKIGGLQFIAPKNDNSNTFKSKTICDFDSLWQSKLGAKEVVWPLKIKFAKVVDLSLEPIAIHFHCSQSKYNISYNTYSCLY